MQFLLNYPHYSNADINWGCFCERGIKNKNMSIYLLSRLHIRRSKKNKTCLASPPASFFEAACFFLFFFNLKKLLKKQEKYDLFQKNLILI